jgi:predicted enzyme related to lactoylglutathione lyase
MRLDQAMIFVKDLERMTAFYRDIVGLCLTEPHQSDGWAEFKTDGLGFSLHAIPASYSGPIDNGDPPVPREGQSLKLIFSTDDPDKEAARLKQLGVAVLHRPWGGWDFVDPEGNVVGVRSSATTAAAPAEGS